MKKLYYVFMLLMAGTAVISSCIDGKNNNGDGDEDSVSIASIDSISVPDIMDAVGIVGDGTSMNVIELINDNGDTLYIECPSEMVVGGVEVGERLAVTYHNGGGENHAMTSINISALEHLWTQQGEDGHEQSLELNEGGRATTYDMTIEYDGWSIADGKILLHSPKKIASEQSAVTDTFDIMELSEERLVLMHGNIATEFEREN